MDPENPRADYRHVVARPEPETSVEWLRGKQCEFSAEAFDSLSDLRLALGRAAARPCRHSRRSLFATRQPESTSGRRTARADDQLAGEAGERHAKPQHHCHSVLLRRRRRPQRGAPQQSQLRRTACRCTPSQETRWLL